MQIIKKAIYILFYIQILGLVYSAQSNSFSSIDYNRSNNCVSVNKSIDSNDLQQKFNEKYLIDPQSLVEIGIFPFSTLYMIENNKSYSIEYDIISSYQISDVYIELDESIKNSNSEIDLSQRISMRGVDLAQITFYPIVYDSNNHILTIIENFDIYITEQEIDYSSFEQSHPVSISKDFEKILSGMVVNLEIGSRTTDDMPSILYVCGGSSLGNSYLQDLIQWRKEQGFRVYTINTSEIGNDFYSIKGYISDAYYNWEYPPEHIVLVGDTGGSYQIGYSTASGGESDYPYTLIDGDDLLPELFIGRISANSANDLSNIINKTLAYEKATFIDYTGFDWFESSALVGDPSATGNSAIITNEYVENILNAYEFDNVETCYNCGSYSSWMQNRLEDGILYFNYRGYIGTSGFGSSHINNANNGYMTPFVTFITCSTGGFSGTAITEHFIRAGSTSNPKGAVAAIGTATSATHTVPNNIVDMGIYDGIFSKKLNTAGAALVNAKMSLYNTYPTNPSQMVYKFTYWNNLMGDPVLHLWTDTPKNLNVEYSEIINLGTDIIQVNVTDDSGNPIEDARAVIFVDEENVFYAFTDANGDATVNSDFIDLNALDSISITVLKHDYIPFSDDISISNFQLVDLNSVYVGLPGEGDGEISLGETVEVYFYLENESLQSLQDLDASISTDADKIDILIGDFDISELPIGDPTLVGPVELFIHNDMNYDDNRSLILTLSPSDDSSQWNFNIDLEVDLYNFIITSMNLYSNEQLTDQINPGDTIELMVSLEEYENNADGTATTLMLSSNSSLIDIIDGSSYFSDGVGTNTEDKFILEFSQNIIDGSIFTLIFNLTDAYGYNQEIPYNITVGIANQQDPLGPDSYGYYIYDWTDIGYSLTPFYDWIEIDPSQGGMGSDLGISDSGNGNSISNSTKYIDLPFTFTFYGEDYDEISVNANGWISFGHSNMESFRNYQLPGAGGPSPMVAAFWDDLKTSSNSKVLKYVAQDYVVIEWLNMKTYQHNDNQIFQIILYDIMTPTGDDEIKIQYKEFNNTTNGDYAQYTPYHGCYSTVGIENHLSQVGLEYTFDNDYPTSAAPLQDESAIFITTRNTTVLTEGDVNQDEEINVLDIVLVVGFIIGTESLDSIGQFVADVDDNGMVNILDVILIINLVLDS